MNYPTNYIRNEKLCSMMESAIESKEPILWLFTGLPGTGKTMAAEVMFNELVSVIEHRKAWAIKSSAHRLYSDYLAAINGNESNKAHDIKWLNSILCKQIVLLDDLGCEQQTESSKAFIANIFSEQYDWLRAGNTNHVIITTNMNSKAISDAYGERIIDRIYENYTIVKFTNESFRKAKLRKVEV
jgi:DNA replication protein DnaC